MVHPAAPRLPRANVAVFLSLVSGAFIARRGMFWQSVWQSLSVVLLQHYLGWEEVGMMCSGTAQGTGPPAQDCACP